MDWVSDFFYPDSCASYRFRSEVFFAIAGLDFVFAEETLMVVCFDLYLCGVKQESDCLCHVGTATGADWD